MNFQPHLAELVMAGKKDVTRRLVSDNPHSPWYRERCKLVVGRSYAVCPGRGKNAIGRVVIVAVDRMRLGRLTAEEARREGFPSVLAFNDAFTGINGSYDPDAEVWRVEFRPVGSEATR